MATRVNILDRAPNFVIRALQVTLANFENPVGLDRPLWRDYSRYDLDVNLTIAQLNGVSGAAFRYAMGWGGTDDTFSGRWSQAGDLDNFYRTGYSVLYPSLDVELQCDHWFDLMPDIDVIPRVLDAELQDGQSDAKVGEAIWKACEIIKAKDGIYPIIYSRYLLLDKWLRYWSQDDINSKWYWGARYLFDRTREHPGPPFGKMNYVTIPEDRIVLHQTADKKAPFQYETGRSTIVDWDRWEVGNEDEMKDWIALNWGEGTVPPVDGKCNCQDEIYNLQTQIDDLKGYHNQSVAVLQEQVSELDKNLANHDHESGLPEGMMEWVVTDEKTLACVVNGFNNAGYPIIDGNFYEPRIRWDFGDIVIADTMVVKADGGSLWHKLATGQNGPNYIVPSSTDLYVKESDIKPR